MQGTVAPAVAHSLKCEMPPKKKPPAAEVPVSPVRMAANYIRARRSHRRQSPRRKSPTRRGPGQWQSKQFLPGQPETTLTHEARTRVLGGWGGAGSRRIFFSAPSRSLPTGAKKGRNWVLFARPAHEQERCDIQKTRETGRFPPRRARATTTSSSTTSNRPETQ